MMTQVKFRFMGQDIVKRSTDSIINRFFFSKPNLEKIWIDVFKRNNSFTLFQRNMYKYKNKGSLVKILQLIIDYRQESSEVTPQTLIINAVSEKITKFKPWNSAHAFRALFFPSNIKRSNFIKIIQIFRNKYKCVKIIFPGSEDIHIQWIACSSQIMRVLSKLIWSQFQLKNKGKPLQRWHVFKLATIWNLTIYVS